jgi:lysophospholipase L1-like esterase
MKRLNGRCALVAAGLTLWISQGLVVAANVDPQKAKADPDGKTLWYDCKDLSVAGKGWSETKSFYDRLPAKAEKNVPPSVWNLSRDSTGLCVRFTTDATSIQVRWTLLHNKSLAMPHMPATGVSGVDLYTKGPTGRWRFVLNGRPEAETNTVQCATVPGQPYLLYLPLYNGVRSVEIGIAKDRAIAAPEDAAGKTRKSLVFYGTSITQGGCASRPGMACTAIVGRRLDVPVINLGFSGSGKMETAMADLLAELDPAVYVLDCLPNMSPALVSERIAPFVKRLREAHPDTPILLAEDPSVRDARSEKGRMLRSIVERLSAQGVQNLYVLSNEGMLGDDGEGTVDGGHPNDLGMMRQADTFIKALRPLMHN